MSLSCPISFQRVDATVARINALNVTVLLLAFLTSSIIIPLYLLLTDFFIRLFVGKKYSPLHQLSCFILNVFHLKSVMVDAGAKRLAAYFGLLFSFILIMAFHLNFMSTVYSVSALFITCTFLEVTFNYCIGCKIYYIIKRIFPKFEV